eukprot:jgi/Hompol1/5223/HPOL_000701-RA
MVIKSIQLIAESRKKQTELDQQDNHEAKTSNQLQFAKYSMPDAFMETYRPYFPESFLEEPNQQDVPEQPAHLPERVEYQVKTGEQDASHSSVAATSATIKKLGEEPAQSLAKKQARPVHADRAASIASKNQDLGKHKYREVVDAEQRIEQDSEQSDHGMTVHGLGRKPANLKCMNLTKASY